MEQLKEILKNATGGASIEVFENKVLAKHHTCDNRAIKNLTKMLNDTFSGMSIIANTFEIKVFLSDSFRLKRA